MRLAVLALLLFPALAIAQTDEQPDPATFGACAVSPPPDSLVYANVGVHPSKRTRYFCAETDLQMAGMDAPISSHIGPPGEGPEWRYVFLAPPDYAPPAGGLECEADEAYMGPPPQGLTMEPMICRGEFETEGGVWAFGLQYTKYTQVDTGEDVGASATLVIGHRTAGDG